MSIQIDNGDFTRIHNDILDGLAKARFSALEFRCLFFLVRMTYGWQKKEDAISLSQWATGIGIDEKNRGNILNTLNGLVAEGVIYTRSNGKTKPATWGLNKSYFDKDAVMQTHNSKEATTVMSEHNSLERTVMPEDNSTVMQPHNKTVMQPHNHKRKERKIKEKGERAPKAPPHPAVIVFHDIWNRNPNKPQMKTISEHITDLDLWREACQAWGVKGHRPTNVDGMLDWYDHPERFRTAFRPSPSGGDYAPGRSTNNGVNAVMDYIQDKGLFK